mmetsp:Transcript_6927/g.22307  ORF Transcript_6927/g.22307 Transcript_6927/m.22307 type:complete len:378 (-) Transcript_6927:46-1179(-)
MGYLALGLNSGRPPFLSQQLLAELDAAFPGEHEVRFVMGIGTLQSRQTPAALAAFCESGERDLREFFDLGRNRYLIANVHDPNLPPPDAGCFKGSDQVVTVGAGQESVSFSVASFYAAAKDQLRANAVVAPYEAVNATYTRKFMERALARTETCAKIGLEWAVAGQTLLWPVVGSTPELCERSLGKLIANVSADLVNSGSIGVCFPNLTACSREDRLKIVSNCLAKLEEAFPDAPTIQSTAFMGSCDPFEVLEVLALGVDTVETSLPYVMTRQSLALAVSCEGQAGPETSAVNLRDSAFARDQGPLVNGCKCWACANHTRGYVHHLLNCSEMLAEMLLFHHNAHQMLSLTARLRELPSQDAQNRFIGELRAATVPPQ